MGAKRFEARRRDERDDDDGDGDKLRERESAICNLQFAICNLARICNFFLFAIFFFRSLSLFLSRAIRDCLDVMTRSEREVCRGRNSDVEKRQIEEAAETTKLTERGADARSPSFLMVIRLLSTGELVPILEAGFDGAPLGWCC